MIFSAFSDAHAVTAMFSGLANIQVMNAEPVVTYNVCSIDFCLSVATKMSGLPVMLSRITSIPDCACWLTKQIKSPRLRTDRKAGNGAFRKNLCFTSSLGSPEPWSNGQVIRTQD